MRLPGANRFTPEAVQAYNNEKDQGGWAEYARFEYYSGSGNPDWPEAVMEAEPIVCYASTARSKRFAAAAYGAVS